MAKLQKILAELKRLSQEKARATPTSLLDDLVPGAYRLLTILEKEGLVSSYVKGAKKFAIDEATGKICNGRVNEVLHRNKSELLRQARDQKETTNFLKEYCENKKFEECLQKHFKDIEPNNVLVEAMETRGLRDGDYRYGRIIFRHNQRRWWAKA